MACAIAWVFLMFAGAGLAVGCALVPPSRRWHAECVFCGYSLRGDCSLHCPECGRAQPHPWHPVAFTSPAIDLRMGGSALGLAIAVAYHGYVATLRGWNLGSLPPPALVVPALLCLSGYCAGVAALLRARREGSKLTVKPVLCVLANLGALLYLILVTARIL